MNMNRRTLGMVALGAMLGGSLANAAEPQDKNAGKAAAKANNAFGLDLYQQISQGDGNVFFSPASISTALAMTYAGARTETAAEMGKVLHLQGLEDAHAEFGGLLAIANEKSKLYELTVANRLWGQKGYPFEKDYLALTEKHYGAGLDQLDFVEGAEAARDTINGWVEHQTREKIKEIMPKGSVTPMTRLVLTNAIYFKGTWQHKFAKELTKEQPFFKPGGKVDAKLMFQEAYFGHADHGDLQTLVMPYKGNKLAMVVLLPKKKDGLPAIEKQLTTDKLAAWTKGIRHGKVQVWLPRFTLTEQYNLGHPLSKLGMSQAMTNKADFSGINGRRDLSISAVVHKAFVDVNETGTEAAAATGIAVGITSLPVAPPPKFRADHPFLYLIVDRRTDAVLFMGRMADPS